MPSCDDCGLVFESVSDLARHMNRWCPENNDLKRKRDDDDEMPSKKSCLEEQAIIDDSEDVAFTKLAELAREYNAKLWNSKVEKYVKEGLGKSAAERKANRKLKEDDMDQLITKYGSLIQYILQLGNGNVHSKIMTLINDLIQDETDYKKAIRIAIRKYKHLLENYIDEINDESIDMGEESDNEDEDDDESEEEDDESEEGDAESEEGDNESAED